MAQDSANTLALVGCGSQKQDAENCPVEAQYLYTSGYFQHKRDYAKREADVWGILSAEYGFVWPETELPWYDAKISKLSEGRKWADESAGNDVRAAVQAHDIDEVLTLAGRNYRVPIAEHIIDLVEVVNPLEGMGIGTQTTTLKEANIRGTSVDELEDY